MSWKKFQLSNFKSNRFAWVLNKFSLKMCITLQLILITICLYIHQLSILWMYHYYINPLYYYRRQCSSMGHGSSGSLCCNGLCPFQGTVYNSTWVQHMPLANHNWQEMVFQEMGNFLIDHIITYRKGFAQICVLNKFYVLRSIKRNRDLVAIALINMNCWFTDKTFSYFVNKT